MNDFETLNPIYKESYPTKKDTNKKKKKKEPFSKLLKKIRK